MIGELKLLRCRGRDDEEEHERDEQARARVGVPAAGRAAAEATAGDEQANAEHDEPDSRRREYGRRGEANGLRIDDRVAGTNSKIEDQDNG